MNRNINLGTIYLAFLQAIYHILCWCALWLFECPLVICGKISVCLDIISTFWDCGHCCFAFTVLSWRRSRNNFLTVQKLDLAAAVPPKVSLILLHWILWTHLHSGILIVCIPSLQKGKVMYDILFTERDCPIMEWGQSPLHPFAS